MNYQVDESLQQHKISAQYLRNLHKKQRPKVNREKGQKNHRDMIQRNHMIVTCVTRCLDGLVNTHNMHKGLNRKLVY